MRPARQPERSARRRAVVPGMLVAMQPATTSPRVPCCRVRCSGSAGNGTASGRRSRAAAALLAALLTACSFKYSDADASPTQLLGHIPDTDLAEVTHTIVRNGRVAAEFRARQVRNFPRAGRTELYDVIYSEYDRNGILVTAGNADRAVYYTEREDAEVAGAIRLRSQSQGVWLEAETLHWEDASHRLFSGPEETVAITRDDGSQVTGVGLQVEVRRKTIRFSGRVSGTLVAETSAEE